jgi:hypothetical protein
MERVVPWKELEEEVSPVAPSMKPGQLRGRPAEHPLHAIQSLPDETRSARSIGAVYLKQPFPRKLPGGGGSNIAISAPKRRDKRRYRAKTRVSEVLPRLPTYCSNPQSSPPLIPSFAVNKILLPRTLIFPTDDGP